MPLLYQPLYLLDDRQGNDRHRRRRDAKGDAPVEGVRALSSGHFLQINFRADDETKAALDALTKDGTSVSEVIRRAIKDARWAALRAEAIAQAKRDSEDPAQIAIMEQVRRDMDSISAW